MKRGASMLVAVLAAALVLGPGVAAAATIKVNTTDDNDITGDDGNCSLRDAVVAAGSNAEADGCPKGQSSKRDVIKLKAREYSLTHPAGDLNTGTGGPLTIRGKTSDTSNTEIQQLNSDRVLAVSPGANVTLEKLELTNGDVAGEDGADALGGIIVANGAGTRLTLRNVEIGGGQAVEGGGIHASGDTRLVVDRSRFTLNSASLEGGGLATDDEARVTIRRSDFFANVVDSTTDTVYGGAIDNRAFDGSMAIVDTTFLANDATASGAGNQPVGGAIHSGAPLEINRSMFEGNTAVSATAGVIERGGGLTVTGDQTEIVNSTFEGNEAGDSDGFGGAVFSFEGAVTLQHVTLVDNLATDGGDSLAASDPGTIEFGGSILDDAVIGSPCDGDGITSVGHNVAEDDHADCGHVGSDLVNSAALDVDDEPEGNGGPTETIKIGKSSDARDFVGKAGCTEATGGVDQRGFERPAGPKCDAGAYERGAKKP